MSLYERLTKTKAVAAPARNGRTRAAKPAQPRASAPPASDVEAELKGKIHQALLKSMGPRLYDTSMTAEAIEKKVRQKLPQLLAAGDTPLSASDRQRLVLETIDDIVGHGPIEPLLRDPSVTEIMVNGIDTVYVEREGKIYRTESHFVNEGQLRRTIDKIVGRVGRRIDESQPYVDARLPDGSRVNAAIPPVSVDGPVLTIRKFGRTPFTAVDLVELGTMSEQVARFVESSVRGRINVLVSGGTGTGKTTTLNVLSGFIPEDERIITIEDAAELRLAQPHVVRLEARPPNIESRGEITIRDLVRNSLRMRPDRIVVGEVRGGEALDMLQAMNTGHDGSISTIHANSPRDVLSRLETMVLMAGMDLPVRAIREQIASAIHLIVHQSRLKDGSRRITHVTEVVGMEGDVVTLQDLFLFDFGMGVNDQGRHLGRLKSLGIRPNFLERLQGLGIRLDAEIFRPETVVRRGRR